MGDRGVLCRFWAEIQNINGSGLGSPAEKGLQTEGAESTKLKVLGKGVRKGKRLIEAFIRQIFHFKPHICLLVFHMVGSAKIHQEVR